MLTGSYTPISGGYSTFTASDASHSYSANVGGVTAANVDVFLNAFVARCQVQADADDALNAANISKALTHLEFLQRFTQAERLAILARTKTDATAEDIWTQFNVAQFIMPGDPLLADGLQYFVSTGDLTSARATTIGGA
jgi:hypothetical protein